MRHEFEAFVSMSFRAMPVFYFLNPFDTHLLDFFMQSLWNETPYEPKGDELDG
jgi:hypothetical protein